MSGCKDRHDDDDNRGSLFFPCGKSSDANRRILLIAIIVLSTVVVVVTMLHVYARYMLRRQARRRMALQARFITRIHSEELPKKGLEPDVIAALPILMYKSNDHGQDVSQVNPVCAVCLSSFEDGQMIRALPSCKHHFHAECIDKWLGSQSSCPICRYEVELGGPTILPLPREPSTRLGGGVSPPSAPPLEDISSTAVAKEGASDEMVQSSSKVSGTASRLGSFRRMLSMDTRRNNSCTQDGIEDLERQ
ncbi:hypothetical protein SSX86_016669 [Deinandra increscens subsp. villosa]|uniref:RING-type E3 ubiquitin transferase n=1 Tax=Deinandra increscens subsp. villosa TaxID=3103831 RepID=A0AAP0D048_9ASTR